MPLSLASVENNHLQSPSNSEAESLAFLLPLLLFFLQWGMKDKWPVPVSSLTERTHFLCKRHRLVRDIRCDRRISQGSR